MRLGHRTRVGLIGTCAVLVALIAIAFAVGGSGSTSNASLARSNAGTSAMRFDSVGAGVPAAVPTTGPVPMTKHGPVVAAVGSAPEVMAPETAPQEQSALPGAASGTGSGGGSVIAAGPPSLVPNPSSVDATRIVKTGELAIRVAKKDVEAKTQALTTIAAAQGGYVASSNVELGGGQPSGEVVLRVPVTHFEAAIAAAQKLGTRTLSLTTSAEDVTGRYVDLSARVHALERTRSTYLTILSRARTIGETLSVQQRVDDVQQQIDRLQGQIKLLGNQASYSTLTVDVVPAGTTPVIAAHHHRHGIGKAWHDSWSRFGRGVDAMVGAIGPIVFAILLLGLFGLIGYTGYRGIRRATSGTQAAS